jgi:hypothetical protein
MPVANRDCLPREWRWAWNIEGRSWAGAGLTLHGPARNLGALDGVLGSVGRRGQCETGWLRTQLAFGTAPSVLGGTKCFMPLRRESITATSQTGSATDAERPEMPPGAVRREPGPHKPCARQLPESLGLRVKKKVAPQPGEDSTQMRPPWWRKMRSTIASPMPVPSN